MYDIVKNKLQPRRHMAHTKTYRYHTLNSLRTGSCEAEKHGYEPKLTESIYEFRAWFQELVTFIPPSKLGILTITCDNVLRTLRC